MILLTVNTEDFCLVLLNRCLAITALLVSSNFLAPVVEEEEGEMEEEEEVVEVQVDEVVPEICKASCKQ